MSDITAGHNIYSGWIITLAMKRRWKGMVIIVCLSVCKITNIGNSNNQTSEGLC